MNEIMTIGGIDCYEKDGTAYLNLEAVARGLGFTRPASSGNEVVRWERVDKYLRELGVPTSGHDGYIPESVFYRLAMKAKNSVAEAFQANVAEEIIPSIRKHGLYMTPAKLQETLAKPENLMVILQTLADEQMKNAELTEANQKLEETNLLLASGEHQWSGKALLNALVRSYAKNCCGGNNGYAWTYYYKQLKYKHGIDVNLRKARNKDKNVKKIDLINDNEMNTAVKLAAAICEQSGLDVPYIVNLVNAGDIYTYEAS